MLGVQIVEGERAAGLIITMNQDHAPQVQRLVLRVTGETAERACSREKYIEVRSFDHSWTAALLALASVLPHLGFGHVVSVECTNFSKAFRSFEVLIRQELH